MAKGFISQNRLLTKLSASWEAGTQDLVVLVDTGFTGELKLPVELADELGLEAMGSERIILGNNQTISMATALAVVSFEGLQKTVQVLIAPGNPLIGVGLMKKFECRMNADFPGNAFTLNRKAAVV